MTKDNDMKIIGITGGVGSGKSAVLEHLRSEYQAVVYLSDEVAKKLQQEGEICYEQIVQHFGKEILAEDGQINRGELAKIVFSNEKELQVLNQIVHPAVRTFFLNAIEQNRKAGTRYLIIEAALLLENNYDEICDEIWYIHASEEVRRIRLKISRGYDDEKISNMIASQLPEREFFKRCDAVVENSGDFEETKRQIGELLE